MKNKILALLLSITVIFTSMSVYANDLNKSYITEDFWINNSSVSKTNFQIESANISGVCSYIFNSTNNAIYFRFDFAGKINNSKLKINFNLDDGETNNFSINQNGMCDYNGNEDTKYDVIYNFDFAPMIGIKIPNDRYINYISVNLYYQGRNQIILNNLLFDATPNTTLKTTKPAVKTQTTKKTITEKSTKYIPQSSKYIPNNHQEVIITSSVEEQTSTTQYYYSQDDVNSSNKRIITATLGAVAIVVSIVFLIIYFAKKRNPLDD